MTVVSAHQQWIDLLVAALRASLGERLGSITLFGSWVHDHPRWPESDLDVLLLPAHIVDVAFLQGIEQAIEDVAHVIPYPIAPIVRNPDELEAMLGPLCAHLYAHSAKTVYGEDLVPLFQHIAQASSQHELQRSALCALALTRQTIRSLVATTRQWSIPSYRHVLRECLGALRCAYWGTSGIFLNDFADVIPRAEIHFRTYLLKPGLIERLWDTLNTSDEPQTTVIDLAFLCEVIAAIEVITNAAQTSLRQLDGSATLHLGMQF